ncbi:cytochrome P450 [Zychaea mexicana]|uniref:cytochrome P450 n=1 Tax=Zychaea mexicana TaxID=64656 RepID=UPI0022FE1D86|nr:cytochrome P450 [Zychaea mexicana]KAI9489088.1 cytochrome P450 [Zychaea mexicana]
MIQGLIARTIRNEHVNPYDYLQLNALNYVLNTCLGTEVETKFSRERREAVLGPLIQEAIKSDRDNMIKHMHQHQSGTGIEDIDLTIAASDMITAGTDTVTAAGYWFIAILLHHPTVCKKISDEVDAFIKEHGRLPLPYERDSLPYFIAVQKECLRYRPFIFLGIPHELQKDVQVQNYLFPRGVPIYPLLYAMHQNPDRYPEPDKFIPERFLGKTDTAAAAGKIEDRDIFLFGFGRRACLGVHASR